MFTFSKPLDEIIEADLQRLIDDQWKKIASLNTSASSPALQTQIKKNLSTTLFPSRTALGGHIIFGIAESNGIPTKPAPISEARIDEAKLRLGLSKG
jgi:hypothetical protein